MTELNEIGVTVVRPGEGEHVVLPGFGAVFKLSGKTKILGTGPLKTVTAVWDTAAPSAALPVQPQSSASDKPYIPGLADDPHPTTPMIAVPPPVEPPGTTTA